MSTGGAVLVLLALTGLVLVGILTDWVRNRADRADHDADAHHSHQRLMREVRRHDDQQIRWRR